MTYPPVNKDFGSITLDWAHPDQRTLTEASSLLNSYLGDGFVRPSELEQLTTGRGVLVRALDGAGQLVGAATARVLNQRDLYAVQERLRRAGIRADLVGNLVGELKSAAVVPEARGLGIGSAMIRARMEFLAAQGCAMILCASWATAGRSSQGLLEAAGFRQLAAIPGYWSDEQSTAGYLCPSCGTHCVCTAFVMLHGDAGHATAAGSGAQSSKASAISPSAR